MKKYIILLLALGMVFSTVPSFAIGGYYQSPIDISSDGYISFGDSTQPSNQMYDAWIGVDESSISSHWVNISFEILPSVIDDRGIDYFYILANGKIVEKFYPQYSRLEDGTTVTNGAYVVKPSSDQFIGSSVNFQIVAIDEGVTTDEFSMAVAWTEITTSYSFDPLPVSDSESISLLQQILQALEDMKSSLEGKLDKLTSAVENMFTPSQTALTRFENARQGLFEATPVDDFQNNMQNITNTVENQKNYLVAPVDESTERITIGEKRDWFMIGKEMHLIDLTAIKDEIIMFRELLSAVIWIEFFYFLAFYLTPKLNI